MKLLVLLALTIALPRFASGVSGIVKIEIGKDYNQYSKKELRERLWRLEKAVWQLQQKVFHLEHNANSNGKKSWVCTLSAMGDKFSFAGETRAVAKAGVINKCTSKRGDGFFCKSPTCEQ